MRGILELALIMSESLFTVSQGLRKHLAGMGCKAQNEAGLMPSEALQRRRPLG